MHSSRILAKDAIKCFKIPLHVYCTNLRRPRPVTEACMCCQRYDLIFGVCRLGSAQSSWDVPNLVKLTIKRTYLLHLETTSTLSAISIFSRFNPIGPDRNSCVNGQQRLRQVHDKFASLSLNEASPDLTPQADIRMASERSWVKQNFAVLSGLSILISITHRRCCRPLLKHD